MVKRVKRETGKGNLIAVHFQNGLGNFIMMTPAIQALADMYDAKVDIVLDDSWTDSRRPGVEEFCGSWPLVNEVIKFQDGFDESSYAQLYLSRHGETCEAFNYFLKNIKGYEPSHINWRAEKLHEVDFYMSGVYDIGYRGSVPKQYCINGGGASIQSNPAVVGDGRFLRIGFCNGFFAGSKWKWERKGWPHFEELANLFERYYMLMGKFKLMLFGKGKTESEWASKFGDKPYIINLVDKLNINGVVQMLKKLDLLITTDTGIMHLADALEIPMIVLFGPTILSKNGPYNNNHRIARSPMRCSPCQVSPLFLTCEKWRCMEELTAPMVMSTVRQYMEDLKVDPYRLRTWKREYEFAELKPCLTAL